MEDLVPDLWKSDSEMDVLIVEKKGTVIHRWRIRMKKKSTAEMLLILTILNVISKQNTTNRVEKNDLV